MLCTRSFKRRVPPPMNCPNCGSLEIGNRRRRLAFYPLAYAAALGAPLAFFHQASVPREYHCHACGLDFARRTGLARFNFVVLIVWGALYVLVILASLLAFLLR
jgi:hypothetical protein